MKIKRKGVYREQSTQQVVVVLHVTRDHRDPDLRLVVFKYKARHHDPVHIPPSEFEKKFTPLKDFPDNKKARNRFKMASSNRRRARF